MFTNSCDVIIKLAVNEDVPNLGSVITLDNKGRLINSQFSKPSSSQNLLKLNHSEEVPDADDLPYAIISYGDTPNIINLPYNDHNYVNVQSTKKIENYDRKALDYLSKQSSQSSSRSSFNTTGSVRISHFSSYNSSTSQNDSFFFNDKYKPRHQFTFNQQVSHTSTPLVTNKTMPIINPNNNDYSKSNLMSGAIVLNSGSVNKLKGVNVIQLRRPSLDIAKAGETRIINLPIKKPSVLTNIMGNNQVNGDRDPNINKSDISKSISLIPRCICRFTHDDGGMIRCEICQTWQHIVCMYPDNKFPIYYKCECCEPRDIDVKRAIATQTNMLIKSGHNPEHFLTRQEFNDYDLGNDSENNFTKSNVPHQFVIVKPDIKSCYRSLNETIPTTTIPIYITASKDGPSVPPGSPRTSKRKQDLISCKSVLAKPNVITSKLNVNNINVNNKLEIHKTNTMPLDNTYNCQILPTSTFKAQLDLRQYSHSPSYFINPMSNRVKAILTTKVQFHTNLSVYNLQYLKQNNFIINTNMYDVVLLDYAHYAVKAVVEFNAAEIIMEYNGYVSLAEEYNNECDFRKHYNPFALFYDKCDRLSMSVDSKLIDNKARYVRRSCTPNAEVKHRLLHDGQIRFYIVPINKIYKDSEITIAFDYNFMRCRYEVECACNQPSCQLLYLRLGTESQKTSDDLDYERAINMYDCINVGLDTAKTVVNMTRPYKKRGRGSKILNIAGKPLPLPIIDITIDNDIPNTSPLKIIRRNKRGRPPLNRATGIHRSDVVPILLQPQENASPEHQGENLFYHEQSTHSTSNENANPQVAILTNFKNFKRMSSNHWSLKNTRKMTTISKKSKPLKKLSISQKVGRPFKIKAEEPVVSDHDEKYFSDHSNTSRESKPEKLSLCEDQNNYSNEENNMSSSSHSNKADLSREEEGKYWLEEINNKILKQKVKEAKKVQRKSKLNRKRNKEKHTEIKRKLEVEKVPEPSPIKELNNEIEITNHIELPVEVIENIPTSKKPKRSRKNQKGNVNYILSYKPSNIDDLKNDLMLITASLKEDKEDDLTVGQDKVKDEYEISKQSIEYIEESIEHLEDNVRYSDLSVDHKEKSMEHDDKSMEHVEESIELLQESREHIDKSSEHIYEHLSGSIDHSSKKINIKDIHDTIINNISEDELHKSRIKRGGVNRNNKSDKDGSTKASREERWVNTMWQRILKNEHNFDNKTKRRRSKSSAAEESIASEENRNDTSEIGSPKINNSDISEDKDSSSNSKMNYVQKQNRKTKLASAESDSRQDERYLSVKLIDCDLKNEKWNNTFSTTSSNSADDHHSGDHKEVNNEQCGLIVYKEQHSNPMEKFSRENSAKLFTLSNVTGLSTSAVTGNINPPPHTKKRWLSQALKEETYNEELISPKLDSSTDPDITERLSSIDSVSKRRFLPPVITFVENIDLSLTNTQKVAINPKKRLLNQFSMEDNALQTGVLISSSVHLKLNKSETNIDQEQSKTKLTLSEYRKRRFVDVSPKDFSNSMTKYQKNSNEFNNAWRSLEEMTTNIEKVANDEAEVEKRNDEVINWGDKVEVENSEVEPHSILSSLSYFDTLNNLPIPITIDPRIQYKVVDHTDNFVLDLPVIFYEESFDNIKKEVIEPKSPSDTQTSPVDYKLFRGGPRTPSESGDLGNDLPTPEGSIRSFASHPSPTSDCHFNFEKDTSLLIESEKPTTVTEPWTNDWTSHTSTIGIMAGIKNPDLLQEIEEFEDEYVPMPDNLPERSKEELETLLLTQKRDSQIREWQEVKQLEREKVKLDHQVRSMARRLHRVNKRVKTTSEFMVENISAKNIVTNYDVKDDEKTMKTFNIQLVNINGRLMEQISMLKNDSVGDNNYKYLRQEHVNLPLSYKFPEDINTSDHLSKYSRHRKKTAISINDNKVHIEQGENTPISSETLSNKTALLTLSSNQNITVVRLSNLKSADTIFSKQNTVQMISSNQTVINSSNQKASSNQNQSLLISNQIEKTTTMTSTTSGTNIHNSMSSLLPPEIRSTLV